MQSATQGQVEVRRPAQVNGQFKMGAVSLDDIKAALREAGIRDDQVTVIDKPVAHRTTIATAEPSMVAKLLGRFRKPAVTEEAHDELQVMVHLGLDDRLAQPVQDVFQRLGATRVKYYPMTEAIKQGNGRS
ncbi:MAG TPA: hypothetical protein VFL91_14230 [Thermomicrobiales bacterium]|nr:hypothetical protein [Thermomicrobiales bacterium]